MNKRLSIHHEIIHIIDSDGIIIISSCNVIFVDTVFVGERKEGEKSD